MEQAARPERSRERRVVTYCVVPRALAPRLYELLREHFRDDPDIEVVIERRERARRHDGERREPRGQPRGYDRRRVLGSSGRRVGERRAAVAAAIEPPPLPRRARRFRDLIAFVRRAEPSSEHALDLDTARLVVRSQAGDHAAFSEIYTRYFDRVYAYLRVALGEHHEAEDAIQEVFTHAFEALPAYELRPGKPFRAWLFRIARNQALGHLRKQGRIEVEDPNHLDRRRERAAEEDPDLRSLEWISDRDLLLFIERLPRPQQQTLSLRYMLGLTTQEIATILDRTPVAVRKLEHRALNQLEHRLTAIGRAPAGRAMRRTPTLVRMRRIPVVRARRFALGAPPHPRR